MFRTQSQVRHLSWEELDSMMRGLAAQISSSEKVVGINPVSIDDTLLASLLANHLKVDIKVEGGLKMSLYSEPFTDICLFKKIHVDDVFDSSVRYFVETVDVDEEGNFTLYTLPWKK